MARGETKRVFSFLAAGLLLAAAIAAGSSPAWAQDGQNVFGETLAGDPPSSVEVSGGVLPQAEDASADVLTAFIGQGGDGIAGVDAAGGGDAAGSEGAADGSAADALASGESPEEQGEAEAESGNLSGGEGETSDASESAAGEQAAPVVSKNDAEGTALANSADATSVAAISSSAATEGAKPQAASADAAGNANPTKWERLAGSTALDTMQKIVGKGFDAAETVVLASQKSYQDALSASALAGKYNAPILLTDGSVLSSQTKSELMRLGAVNVYLIGGRKAVLPAVERALKDMGIAVKRLCGQTAADTAIAVAKELGEDAGDTCIVATGNSFQDALSAAPYAYAHCAPVFLAPKNAALDKATMAAIREGSFLNAVVVGGKKAVATQVDAQLKGAGLSVTRLKGATAYDTSEAIAAWAVKQGMQRENMGVATGRGFQDALSGAALCGVNNAVLLLVDDANRIATDKQYRSRIADVAHGYVFGGRSVVSVVTWEYLHRPVGSTTIIASERTIGDGLYTIAFAKSASFLAAVKGASLSNGANAQLGKSDADTTQKWQIVWRGRGYSIRNLGSRMALAVSGGSQVAGANVVQAAYKASDDAQLWAISKNSDGTLSIRNLKSGMALDVAGAKAATGTNLRQYMPAYGVSQKYKVNATNPLDNGSYMLKSALANRWLEVANASTVSGANVRIGNKGSYSQGQYFRISKVGNYYRIINVRSGKSVEVKGSSKANQANVVQNPSTDADNQLWEAVVTDDCYIKFKNKKSGYMLDVANAKTAAGTNVWQSKPNSNAAQKWQVVAAPSTYYRVYINSGHGWNSNGNGAFDTGAQGSGYREADFASDLTELVLKYGREIYGLDMVDGRPYKLAYWDRLPKAKELGCSSIFSIHFDAGGGSGPMTMVGVSGRHSASMMFNNIVADHLYASLPGLRHRGTSYRNDITCVNGSIPAVLVEVCFMDTPSDVSYYLARKDKVARELAAALYECSQKSSLRK